MALRSRFGYKTQIPSITSRKAQTKQLSFKDGINTYKDNDDLKPTELIAAVDARYSKIGRYKTRKGLSRYSVPVGETDRGNVTSTAGASVATVDGSHSLAQQLTVSAAGCITKSEIRIRSTATSSGSVIVEYWTNVAGKPGVLLARSSIQSSSITSSFAYVPSYFVAAPALTNGQVVWQVIRAQSSTAGAYEISTTTSSALALTRDSSLVWTAAAYSLNAKIYLSTELPVKGLYRAYRSNGLKLTFFAAGDTMYTVNDVTGATTAVKTGMSAAATNYRFAMAQDAVYWVNEYEKPYMYDLATGTVTQITTAPHNAYLIIEHKGLIFYGNPDDRTQTFYTNFGDYDEFRSTDFLTVMAPKSPDSHTAYAKLNGVFYIFARRNKFVVFGDNNATWSIDEAPDQRGTFTQESVAYDADTIYHADESGVWAFNGTESKNLALPFLTEYQAIPNKDSIKLELYNNRLYVFYAPAGQATNTECFVLNLLLDRYESKDLGTHVGRTFARLAQDDIFIQASSKVAALYYGEADSNNYDNLGDQLQFELKTAYSHFDSPGQLKRIPKWRPMFDSAVGIYSVECGYSIDNQTDAQWTDLSLASNSPRYDTGLHYDTGQRYASAGSVEPTTLVIGGFFKRIQRRYRHIAAHEPVEMDSEILTIETQRLI